MPEQLYVMMWVEDLIFDMIAAGVGEVYWLDNGAYIGYYNYRSDPMTYSETQRVRDAVLKVYGKLDTMQIRISYAYR